MVAKEIRNKMILYGVIGGILFVGSMTCIGFATFYQNLGSSYNCDALDPHLTSKIAVTDCYSYRSYDNQTHIFLTVSDCYGKNFVDTLYRNQTEPYNGTKICWYYSGEIRCQDFKNQFQYLETLTLKFIQPPEIKQTIDYQNCLDKKSATGDKEIVNTVLAGPFGMFALLTGYHVLLLWMESKK